MYGFCDSLNISIFLSIIFFFFSSPWWELFKVIFRIGISRHPYEMSHGCDSNTVGVVFILVLVILNALLLDF